MAVINRAAYQWPIYTTRGCRPEGSLSLKTTHIIFRKSAVCFGMMGALSVVMATVKRWVHMAVKPERVRATEQRNKAPLGRSAHPSLCIPRRFCSRQMHFDPRRHRRDDRWHHGLTLDRCTYFSPPPPQPTVIRPLSSCQ